MLSSAPSEWRPSSLTLIVRAQARCHSRALRSMCLMSRNDVASRKYRAHARSKNTLLVRAYCLAASLTFWSHFIFCAHTRTHASCTMEEREKRGKVQWTFREGAPIALSAPDDDNISHLEIGCTRTIEARSRLVTNLFSPPPPLRGYTLVLYRTQF